MSTRILETMSNEELVSLFINEGNDRAFEALMKNTEGLRFSIANKFNIPGMDTDDLIQEGAIEMLNKLSTYKANKTPFTSFLYMILNNRYINLYNSVTCGKRNLVEDISIELIEYNEDNTRANDRGCIDLSVDCDEFKVIELLSVIRYLKLSTKERVVAEYLAKGWDKPSIADETGMSNAQVCVLSQRIGKKMILAGV